jgi:hypothetical protein
MYHLFIPIGSIIFFLIGLQNSNIRKLGFFNIPINTSIYNVVLVQVENGNK